MMHVTCSPPRSQVAAKANVVSVDSCAKTCVVFGDLISMCEVVNSRSLQVRLRLATCTVCMRNLHSLLAFGFTPTLHTSLKDDCLQITLGPTLQTPWATSLGFIIIIIIFTLRIAWCACADSVHRLCAHRVHRENGRRAAVCGYQGELLSAGIW
jgi:hypothetical protein